MLKRSLFISEYDRCHSPLGMEDFDIPNDQITASSQKSQTTPAFSGRRNAVKGFGLDGAWCAATNDRVFIGLNNASMGLFSNYVILSKCKLFGWRIANQSSKKYIRLEMQSNGIRCFSLGSIRMKHYSVMFYNLLLIPNAYHNSIRCKHVCLYNSIKCYNTYCDL